MGKQQFGHTLKALRKQRGLSQKQVCQDICSQPMLSAIEAGKYLPNSRLLIQLCQRLEIQAEVLVLDSHYAISENLSFSQKVEELCNSHQYKELQEFLLQPEILEQLTTQAQFQAYYYYLGCCEFHNSQSMLQSEENFKLSLAEVKQAAKPSSLTRLAFASLAIISAKRQQHKSTIAYLEQSLLDIKTAPYEANLNIIFYLDALALFELKDYPAAAAMIEEGVAFITSHDSHFMLANLFYLLALTAEKSAESSQLESASNKSALLEDLFQEAVFKEI
ncbi:helix-turn-helix domain-containing protein [Enterococcus sp. HY326]|uniref:helix-turn-helix domain-containing protein n=1 Tax=Enterococcus sp. HY326 TaxID=2971265 RepID=UPI00223EF6B7|nr:helix-turn-helix transcriptional regulator [Enterococcus sp. HY326]